MAAIVHSLEVAEACNDDNGGKPDENGDTDDVDRYKNHQMQMQMQGATQLSKVLLAVMNSSAPPMRKKVDAIKAINNRHVPDALVNGPVFCAVTGVELEEMCIEVRPAGKTSAANAAADAVSQTQCADQNHAAANNNTQQQQQQYVYLRPLVVHTDLEHFFNMFWYCYKLEHVVRHIARCWLEDCNNAAPPTTAAAAAVGAHEEEEEESAAAAAAAAKPPDMQGMCEKFAKEHDEVIKDMHAATMHAFSHFVESIYSHPCMQVKSDEVSAAEKEAQETRHNESAKRKRVRNSAAAAASVASGSSKQHDQQQDEPVAKKPKGSSCALQKARGFQGEDETRNAGNSGSSSVSSDSSSSSGEEEDDE
jgi:hypothetical protein